MIGVHKIEGDVDVLFVSSRVLYTAISLVDTLDVSTVYVVPSSRIFIAEGAFIR